MQENLFQKILVLLDSGRFLTLKEIAKLLKMPEKPVEETLLHLVRLQKMNRRHFAGRDYFQTTQPQQATSKLSAVADDYLDQRQAAPCAWSSANLLPPFGWESWCCLI
ncbi:hypothetical protein FAM18132_00317 [Lacticaseibacillus paracasei]|nr:hypothetical protein FAM18101_00376 [Lacticaseibacillus paracasei]RND48320.1 hypothetical protein FAM18105_00322 [Lacticaseibacillus paracasei]RND74377.1 hypothetical protein FAM18132_00317 [Lacticaseibacillus paracasei]RNE08436.1 hypothetical protein FAM22280_02226 [Lacticaseibacillus paracasei]